MTRLLIALCLALLFAIPAFAVPGDPTPLPEACAVAWNPSVTGGGKSEDTALVTPAGVEVLTRTRGLAELETTAGVLRPALVEL